MDADDDELTSQTSSVPSITPEQIKSEVDQDINIRQETFAEYTRHLEYYLEVADVWGIVEDEAVLERRLARAEFLVKLRDTPEDGPEARDCLKEMTELRMI